MTKKILLADDSITIQKVVRITLADGDYELIPVDNGDDALVKIREIRPDLILADVVMPGKDGYQVCQAVKSDPQLQHIPVVLLAGSFEGFDEMKGAQIGADGYIIKPFESQTLVSKVEELLARGPVAPLPAAAAAAPVPPAPEEEIPLTTDFEPSQEAPAGEDLWAESPTAQAPAEEDIFAEPELPPPPEPEPPAAAEPTLPGGPAEPEWPEPEPAAAEPAGEWLDGEEPIYPQPEWHAEEAAPAEAGVEEAIPFAEEAPSGTEAAPAEEEIPLADTTPYQAEGYAVEGEPFAEAVPAEMEVQSPAEAVMEAFPYAETAEGEIMEAVLAEEEIPVAEAYAETGEEDAPPAEAYAPEAETMAYAETVAEYAEPAEAVPAEPEALPADWGEAVPVMAQAADEIAAAAASGMSKEELLSVVRDTVERVVWEVVPQLAEAIIEERIRQLEMQKA
jgi:CheY-like chemotaxis protein